MSIRRNTLYNLLGFAAPVAVSLLTIPLYLKTIGEARYGVLAISWLLLGYFGVFDLGLGRATAQRIAALHDETPELRADTFWTALTLNVGLGVLGGLIIWPVATYFFTSQFKIDEHLTPELQAAVPWLALAVPMATISGVLVGALQGREKFAELNIISVVGTLIFQLLPLGAAIATNPNIAVLLPTALAARLLTLLILFQRCRVHILNGYAISLDWTQVSTLMRFGGWVTVTSLVGPMMVVLDRFVIGALSGAKAVAFYTIPFQLGERTTILSRALTSAMFPRLASATPKEELRLVSEAMSLLIVTMTPVAVGGTLFLAPFLSLWISPTFSEQAALTGQIIIVGFWANSFARVPYAQLQARGRPDLVAKTHLCEVLPYLMLLYTALQNFGLPGAAMAFTLRAVADFVVLSKIAGTLKQSLILLLGPTAILSLTLLVATQANNSQPPWIILSGMLISASIVWSIKTAPPQLSAILTKYRSTTIKKRR